jgi:competence protein ComEA
LIFLGRDFRKTYNPLFSGKFMTLQRFFVALTAAAMLLGVNEAIAYEHAADHPAEVNGKPAAGAKKTTSNTAADKRTVAAKVKLVDINNASRAALKKLPGITDEQAEKIIANRPYGSKAWLVTNKVIEPGVYAGIKALIEAKQPFKTAAKNAAMYEQLKK